MAKAPTKNSTNGAGDFTPVVPPVGVTDPITEPEKVAEITTGEVPFKSPTPFMILSGSQPSLEDLNRASQVQAALVERRKDAAFEAAQKAIAAAFGKTTVKA